MTVECLKSSMLRIERYFGKELSTDERTARAEVYAAALKEIPDDVVSTALLKALTVCRWFAPLVTRLYITKGFYTLFFPSLQDSIDVIPPADP